ncbi:MAG: hypothetical protein B7Z81_02130, partial [Acidocella sp. 20-61-6]
MLLIVAIVDASRRYAWITLLAALALTGAGLFYTAHHLRMDTNTDNLFAKNLPWRQAAIREN